MEFLFAQISNIKKNYFLILVFVLFILINDAFILSDLYSLKCREAKIADSPGNVLTDENNKNIDDNIYVDVKGEVKKPGVYLAKEGMIVDDLIKMAGGVKKTSTTDNINLSKKIYDQMVIIVSPKKQSKNSFSTEQTTIKNDASLQVDNPDNIDYITSGLVNINTASIEELMKLNSIGKAKAEAIISYRETSKFNSIEEIMNVSGIGETLFEKIKDFISV